MMKQIHYTFRINLDQLHHDINLLDRKSLRKEDKRNDYYKILGKLEILTQLIEDFSLTYKYKEDLYGLNRRIDDAKHDYKL